MLICADLLDHADGQSLWPCRRSDADEDFDAVLRDCATRFGSARIWPRAISIAATMRGGSRRLAALAGRMPRVPLIATNDVLYHAPRAAAAAGRADLHPRATARSQEAGFLLAANAERHLKPPDEMARLFRRYPKPSPRTLRDRRRLRASRWTSCATSTRTRPDRMAGPPQQELDSLTGRALRSAIPRAFRTRSRRRSSTSCR